MKNKDYFEYISFAKLKQKIIDNGLSYQKLSDKMNNCIDRGVIANAVSGHFMPTVGSIIKIAAYFQCSIDELVDFYGYDIEYGSDSFIPHEPDPEWHISYDPLIKPYKDKYGNKYKEELTILFNKIETNTQYITNSFSEEYLEERSRNAKSGRVHSGNKKGGLASNQRMRLNNDLSIYMPILYKICKELKCTPSHVVTYR